MEEKARFGCKSSGNVIMSSGYEDTVKLKNFYKVECFGFDGKLKWIEEFENLVVNVGLDHLLDVTLSAGTQITAWYVGLKNSGTVAASDIMSSHAGWTENTTYSNATRPTWTDGGVSSQSVDNSASKAQFNINGTTTIYGAFLTSVNTKGGTTGTLYGAGDFSSSRAVVSGDTLNVTVTATAAG